MTLSAPRKNWLLCLLVAAVLAVISNSINIAPANAARSYEPNEHMFHRDCAEAMDTHAFNSKQKWDYTQWRRANSPRRMGIRAWLDAHTKFVNQQKEERAEFMMMISTQCVGESAEFYFW